VQRIRKRRAWRARWRKNRPLETRFTYDYVDRNIPVLDRMFRRRLVGYRSIGYVEADLPPGYSEADDDWTIGRGCSDDIDDDAVEGL
jgi:hypothetical protein